MGVFTGDRWIVCVCVGVCVSKSIHRSRERGRVTKKGEVTMPKACWDSAQGSRVAEKGRRGVFMRPVRVKQNKRLLPWRLRVVSKA